MLFELAQVYLANPPVVEASAPKPVKRVAKRRNAAPTSKTNKPLEPVSSKGNENPAPEKAISLLKQSHALSIRFGGSSLTTAIDRQLALLYGRASPLQSMFFLSELLFYSAYVSS